MWKCPVCDQENNAATVCPRCGYDRTCDYEQYPTAFAVTTAKPTATLRRQWQEKQNPPVNGRNRKRTVTVTQEQAAQGCRITAGYVDGQRLEITVPAGTKDGSVLRCRGMGQPGSNGGRNGDLLVTVRVQEPPEPDGLYDAPKDPPVKGGDLRATVYITPNQAARGCQLWVTPSGGRAHQVTIPGACTDGKTMRYTGMGQPGSNGGKNGDLLITVRVQEPEAPKPVINWATVSITPKQAARGCVKKVSLTKKKSSERKVGKDDKVSLKLPIPAGVVHGEKLHYPQVRADNGTLFDLTIEVKVGANGALPLLLSLLCLYGAAFGYFLNASSLIFLLLPILSGVFIKIYADGDDRRDSRNKKKYGPKTPEEKRRCETPREMPPQR